MKLLLISLLFVGAAIAQKDAHKEWVYEEDSKLPGPSKWGATFKDCANPDTQSPINIVSSSAVSKRFPDRQPRNWNISLDLLLQNNGESLRFTYIPDRPLAPLLKGGPLPKDRKYQFYLGYVYFGAEDDKGSAHQIDGKSHAMEIVLYEVGENNDYDKPVQEIAAVTIVFDVKEQDNPNLNSFIGALEEIQTPGWSRARVDNLLNFVIDPESQKWSRYRNDYFHYIGTTLTPPCEPVWWILLQEPNYIGKKQIAELRKLKDAAGNPLAGKVRPIQSIGNRQVFRSEKFESNLPV